MPSDRSDIQLQRNEIDLIQLLATLIEFGMTGAEYICKKIDAYFELVTVSENLQDNIEDLKTIVSKVNTRRKNKRDAKVLANNYSANVALWNNTINKIVIDDSKVPELYPLLKLAGYSGSVKPIQEDELFNVLPTFKTDKCDVTLFSAKKKVDIDDMPGIVGNIEIHMTGASTNPKKLTLKKLKVKIEIVK